MSKVIDRLHHTNYDGTVYPVQLMIPRRDRARKSRYLKWSMFFTIEEAQDMLTQLEGQITILTNPDEVGASL